VYNNILCYFNAAVVFSGVGRGGILTKVYIIICLILSMFFLKSFSCFYKKAKDGVCIRHCRDTKHTSRVLGGRYYMGTWSILLNSWAPLIIITDTITVYSCRECFWIIRPVWRIRQFHEMRRLLSLLLLSVRAANRLSRT